MKARYVVDTNVLIAASAGDPVQPRDIDATPKDPKLRKIIWEWLDRFQQSESRLVLDTQSKIYDEYCNKLGFEDYGIQVVIHKWSTAEVDCVTVEYDIDGLGVLPEFLNPVIHDGADKKMVAAALASIIDHGEGNIAFAGDTDWHDWEEVLIQNNVYLEPIVEEWSRAKHAEKKKR